MSEILDDILSLENISLAVAKVCSNKGAGGVDGMDVEEIHEYMAKEWPATKELIRERKYRPMPVLRVEIPKPNGGVRKLGIPTVVDRVIQQAIAQKLSPMFEPLFSEHSYGFRPGRSALMAVAEVARYINEGYEWIVDFDLEKFFDNVPQDRLMSYVGRVVKDGDTESLIRKFLKAGVMVEGVFEKTEVGTPQGGCLSPLLSNIMLNELDKELEARGLHFSRYADDLVVAVRSEASAKRVMHSVTSFIERKLGLKVNAEKTHVCRPNKLKFLGYTFYYDSFSNNEWRPKPHEKSVTKFKDKLKELCCRSWSVPMDYRIERLNQTIRGWINYFRLGDMKRVLTTIDEHLRTMIRIVVWKQWKVPSARQKGLMRLGIDRDLARVTAYLGDHYQFVALKTCLSKAISKTILKRRGLLSCLDYYMYRRIQTTFRLS